MRKGLTFFQLVSPYKEDVTKNCGLSGQEIDNNFMTLKEMDIDSVYWENESLILQRVGGERIAITGIMDGVTKDLSFNYDKDNGALSITMNGSTTLITGFTTSENFVTAIYTDNSLSGSGSKENPIKVSPLFQTGQQKPAHKVIDTTKCERLPDPRNLSVGDRYITVEEISDFGYLYDYNGLSRISADLRDSSSPWRIPTKEDWDNMLNAVEPRDEDKNHDKVTSNKYLGRFAGKLLKSYNYWKLETTSGTCEPPCETGFTNCLNPTGYSSAITYNVGCETSDPYCAPICGSYTPICPPRPMYPNRGIDKFGFAAVPAGYGDDGGNINYFGERGWYWTATNSQCLNAYAKRFEFDKSTVFQEIINVNNLLSIRLVKDYDGTNYNERETILGCDYSTVLMPSVNGGKSIWTSTNIAFTNKYYNPVAPNNGIGLTTTKKYFINEWNGCRWLKKELRNGDSIVIENAPNGENFDEYRVVNNELVSVSEMVYDEVIETVRPELDNLKGMIAAETARAKEAEKQLQSNLDTETARAVFAEQKLQEQVDTLNANLQTETEERKQADEAEAQRVNSMINQLNENVASSINQINQNVSEGFTAINNAIAAETSAREEADKNLQQQIDDIESDSDEDISRLENLIKAEEERAMLAEMELDDKITKEVERSTAKDTELETAINTEVERATAKENEIETKLDEEIKRSTEKGTEIEANIDEIEEKMASESEHLANVEQKLEDEIKRSTEQDQYITERLLNKDGHVFSATGGTLTLETVNPDNKITINLDFDFGTF